jgi:hypothetical protein
MKLKQREREAKVEREGKGEREKSETRGSHSGVGEQATGYGATEEAKQT